MVLLLFAEIPKNIYALKILCMVGLGAVLIFFKHKFNLYRGGLLGFAQFSLFVYALNIQCDPF